MFNFLQRLIYKISIGLLLSLGYSLSAVAVEAFVAPESGTKWSEVIEHPLEGSTVYDIDKRGRKGILRSSWSRAGIRFTHNYSVEYIDRMETRENIQRIPQYDGNGNVTDYQEIVGYEQVPVYGVKEFERSPESIRFNINQQTFVYESGAVSPELGNALANAPNQTMRIKLLWQNGKTTEAKIGKGTVQAWKKIFQ
ncbi:MAG: hypothetical protein HC903_10010 [Methylacidiphilales bacterium]|nr:hypothetical protein [Candidatus Methylacidiphilales bacterium]NJR17097.1 hypothetical protein [Calothrix sp. CSU_2_0]